MLREEIEIESFAACARNKDATNKTKTTDKDRVANTFIGKAMGWYRR